ncbi:baseplate J like family protein [Pantoea phage PdC23]|uniref:Baseplate J like family protein n=1 Tax=Pantoea phage PdC23 TaxID=2894356 RepID=A0AAE8YLM8_9CAUD|nr:baseplate J like family protein [Pantoea phage PdC23]UGC97734.1 baseplate J like family protein [Pantoea phage PdC23]
MSDLDVLYDENGPVAKTASDLRAALVSEATALSPGLTTELPGSIIEDMSSTGAGALVVADQARVDLINSVGPITANLAMLTELAQQYGVPFQKTAGSTTVPIVFSSPNIGFLVPKGFIVSDGTNQYSLNEAAVIRTGGTSAAVTATGTETGTWTVPVNSVTTIVTSVPSNITLTCTNQTAGTPGGSAETNAQYRVRVWDAGMVTVQGYPGFIRTALNAVENIDPRQVSVVQNGNSWVVLCGGGDIYEMAAAIFTSAGDITRLSASSLNVTGITNANPGVVTTDLTHGFSTGQVISITGVQGMTGINGVSLTITVIDAHSFSIGINTTSSGAWTGGGVVTPNLRNSVVSINDWPDTYSVPLVQPFQQLITINFDWATQNVNYLSDQTLLSLVQNPVIDYVNGIYAGQPLNIGKLKDVFYQAINSTVDMTLITTLNVSVIVNGVLTPVDTGTDIISGDKFSYWYIQPSGVSVSEV